MQGIEIPTAMSSISINENIYNVDTTQISKNVIGVNYQPSRFGLSEISPISIAYHNDILKYTSVIASLDYFGFDLYNEFASGAGVITQLKYLEIGGKFTYHRASIKDYGNSSAISVDLFSNLSLLKNLSFAVLLRNINRAYYSNANHTIPQSAVFSIGYAPYDNIGIDFGTNIALNSNASIIAGIKYQFNQYLQANIKCNTSPFLVIAGANLSAPEYLNILFYFRYTSNLGYDQILGLEFRF